MGKFPAFYRCPFYPDKRRTSRALLRKKETRKRNLAFHLPAAISCSLNARLFQNDSSYVTFGDIYDRHCEETGISREDPVLVAGEKVKQVLREFRQAQGKTVRQYRYPRPDSYFP
jgi:transformation/transcription domain-associated protein